MRLFSKKVVTALRRVSRARPTPLIAAASLPVIAVSAPLGTKANPILIDNDNDCEHLVNSLQELSLDINHPISVNHPISINDGRSCAQTFTIVPVTFETTAKDARVCLHNLRHIANQHGFDLMGIEQE
jgi:hypothetical protein